MFLFAVYRRHCHKTAHALPLCSSILSYLPEAYCPLPREPDSSCEHFAVSPSHVRGRNALRKPSSDLARLVSEPLRPILLQDQPFSQPKRLSCNLQSCFRWTAGPEGTDTLLLAQDTGVSALALLQTRQSSRSLCRAGNSLRKVGQPSRGREITLQSCLESR